MTDDGRRPAGPQPRASRNAASENSELDEAIRNYMRTYALRRGRPQVARYFGVSRHSPWRFAERGHGYLGYSLPKAAIRAVGDTHEVIAAAAWAITASLPFLRRAVGWRQPPAETLEDALYPLCAESVLTVAH